MAEATQTVSFHAGKKDGDISLSAELDGEKNGEKTEFVFVLGKCWINLFGSLSTEQGEEPLFDSSFGSISGGEIVEVEKEAKISMENKSWFEASQLSKEEVEIVSYSFTGKGTLDTLEEDFFVIEDFATPVYVNSAGELLGELTVIYKVRARQYKISDVPKPEDYDDEENPGLIVVALFTQADSSATITTTFKGEESVSVTLSAELDTERNEEKTDFPFNTGICWINVFGSLVVGPDATPPDSDVSFGKISGGQIIMTERETKIGMEKKSWFERTQLHGGFGVEIIDASFIGKGKLGTLTEDYIEGVVSSVYVNSAGELLGELTVRYKVMARLYKISDVPKPEDYDDEENPGLIVVALFEQLDSSATVTATFRSTGGPRRVKIKVVNHCSSDPVPGAIVTLGNGLTGGITNSEGIIDIGMVSPGTYPVIDIVKEGYEPPASDVLDNEEIEIPEEDAGE